MRNIVIIIISICAFDMNAQTNFNQTMFLGGYGYNIKYIAPNNYIHDTMPNMVLAGFSTMGTSSICDSNGNLMIISNGMNLFNGDGSAFIEDGDTLASIEWYNFNQGFDRYMQTCLILPIEQKKYYYVQVSTSDTQLYKALNINNDVRMDRLYYSIIDMTMNGGQGKVVQRMKPLIDNKYLHRTGMQACRHANGRDWWVLKMGADSLLGDVIYKYLFTQDSVYDMGTQIMSAPFKGDWGGGQMQFNKEGNKWACNLNNTTAGEVFLADFDRCTGMLNNMSKINVLPETDTPPVYDGADSVNIGICFSPSGNLLYVSRANHIVQYNLQNNTQYMVYGPDTAFQFAWYMKLNLGPDDKIYIGQFHGISNQMSTIDNPDVVGAGCNFCRKCVRSQSSRWLYSLADMPNYDLGVLQPCWPLGNATWTVDDEQLEIFPNPVFDRFQIRTKNQDYKKELYNVTGQLLLTTQKNEINLSNYSKGVYYLKCGNAVRKLVKE